MILSKTYKVRSRFQRSIQLSKDWHDQSGIQEYLISPTAENISKQIITGLTKEEGPRAWSITGPFGTGKSAFALFLTDLLANAPPKNPEAISLREAADYNHQGLIPILLVGHKFNIVPDLLNTIADSFQSISDSITDKARQLLLDPSLKNRDIVNLIEDAAKIAEEEGFGGILIIIDEFGKYLEFISENPDQIDILLMQDLAETVSRSQSPILLVTVLHSAFADYIQGVGEAGKSEWQKVQGRYTDLSFLEPPEQFLKLVGSAIECKNSNHIQDQFKQQIIKALDSPAFIEAKSRIPLEILLPECAPINPIVALLLWPLFRSTLSQNERSLFSFLNDFGPYGFQEFLEFDSTEDLPQSYNLDRLFDYIYYTLGDTLFTGTYARRWAEIHNAIDRISSSAPEYAQDIVKVIGLLGLFGAPVGLKATSETIAIALEERIDSVKFREAIKFLIKTSIIIFRKFDQAFGLWEGSDVDLDSALEQADLHTQSGKLAQRLMEVLDLHPIISKAHYIKKGTLRFFNVNIIDNFIEETSLQHTDPEISTFADGKITFVLSASSEDRSDFCSKASDLTKTDPLYIYAFPKPIQGLEASLLDYEKWRWVQNNVPELAGDKVARNEVKSQLLYAQQKLEKVAGSILGLRGYSFSPNASIWIQGGSIHDIKNPIKFQRWLSTLCEDIFSAAPSFHNELLNREYLSSSAASARRLLLQAMLEKENEQDLGIEGTPAQMSMYLSLLKDGGFHQEHGPGKYSFGVPNSPWLPIWTAIEDFLKTTKSNRRPILDLYRILKSKPFGLREGIIPVLLCAFLLHKQNQVALYEDGIFIPTLRIEVFELITRIPDSFEIQLYELEGNTQAAYSAIDNILNSHHLIQEKHKEPDLLHVVRPLVMFASALPDYTKNTKRLDPPAAISIRENLLRTSDPYHLLFSSLPESVGENINSPGSIERFSQKLDACLLSLQRAYPMLLDEIENQFRDTFNLHGNATEVAKTLQDRANPLHGFAVDRTLALFIQEAIQLGKRDWREVLARVVHDGLPPAQWFDRDLIDFQLKLKHFSSDFVRLESLVLEHKRTGASRILRIGLLNGDVDEQQVVVSVLPNEEEHVNSVVNEITSILNQMNTDQKTKNRLQIAVIAQAASIFLSQEREDT